MLPDIRAVLGVIVAAVALLMMSFALIATFRVAQDTRIGMLQAELAQRGRPIFPANEEPRTALPIDLAAPLDANPVRAVEIQDAPDIPEAEPESPVAAVMDSPQAEPPVPELPATHTPVVERPSSEPPMGGPLPDEAVTQFERPAPDADGAAAKNKKKADQARKARAQRIARERKAAARRAAQARARQEQSAGAFNAAPFGTYGNNTFGNGAFNNSTFGNSSFGTAAIPQPRAQGPAQNTR